MTGNVLIFTVVYEKHRQLDIVREVYVFSSGSQIEADDSKSVQ